jgi:hypothetical protein
MCAKASACGSCWRTDLAMSALQKKAKERQTAVIKVGLPLKFWWGKKKALLNMKTAPWRLMVRRAVGG